MFLCLKIFLLYSVCDLKLTFPTVNLILIIVIHFLRHFFFPPENHSCNVFTQSDKCSIQCQGPPYSISLWPAFPLPTPTETATKHLKKHQLLRCIFLPLFTIQ